MMQSTSAARRLRVGRGCLVVLFVSLLLDPAHVFASRTGSSARLLRNRRGRHLRELSSRVRRNLLSIVEDGSASGMDVAALVPKATRQIHRLLVDSSTLRNEEGEVIMNNPDDAKALAVEALRAGVRSLLEDLVAMEDHGRGSPLAGERHESIPSTQDGNSLADSLSGASKGTLRERELITSTQALFFVLLAFIVAFAVGNIFAKEDIPAFVGPQYVTGIKGSEFDKSAFSKCPTQRLNTQLVQRTHFSCLQSLLVMVSL